MNNIDIELLAGLNINSSEQEILKAIQILQNRLKANASASIKIDAKLDEKTIADTMNKLEAILKTKTVSIDTKNSILQLQKEAAAMMEVVSSANKATKEKLEFANANKRVARSARETAEAIDRERNAMASLYNMEEILARINAQGRQGNAVFHQFGATLGDAFLTYNAARLLQDTLRAVVCGGEEAVETVKELNDVVAELRMATSGSLESAKQLVQDYNTLGQEIGALTGEVAASADAWLRQGHSVEDTNKLIKDSMMLSKISSLNSADATKYLTSAMQGYKVAVDDVIDVVSKLSAVDLESATDAAGLAQAMSRTSESAKIAGVTMDRLLGMIATVGEVTQKSMSSIGESYKTIFSRMRDVKDGKLSVVGDNGEVEDISNVEVVLNELGIKLRESNSEFRNFQEVLDEVAASWNQYSSVQKAAIAKSFSGVRQQENFLVMMENWDKVLKYTDISTSSEGIAEEKFGFYLESLQAKTNALKASLENLAATTISDELYGSVLDVTKGIVDATAASGLLQGALVGIGTTGGLFAMQHLAGYLGEAVQGFANLSQAMTLASSGTGAIQELIDLTADLSNSQIRLLLNTGNLNQAQQIAILTARGLTHEEAMLQLQTWGIATAQQGATAATVILSTAMRGLWLTLLANPLVLVTTTVTAGAMAFNKYRAAQAEAAQAVEQNKQKYQNLTSEVSALNTELETTQKRLKELNAIGYEKLSVVEQEEYNNLLKKNDELERELRIKQALAEVTSKEVAEAASDALTKKSQNSIVQTNERTGMSEKVDEITNLEELISRAENQRKRMKEAQKDIQAFEESWTGSDVDMLKDDQWQDLNDVLVNVKQAVAATESSISDTYNKVETDSEGLLDSFGNVVSGYENLYARVTNARERMDRYFNPESKHTTKDSLEKQFGKNKVDTLSDEELEIAYAIRNISDMDFTELQQAIKEAKKETEEPLTTVVEFSASDAITSLEQLSDGFDKFSAIYDDVLNKEDFDFGSLIDEEFSAMFAGSEELKKQYEDFVSVISNSPADINACQSAFDDLVSAWFYGQAPLKNITEETKDLTVAWLEQKGVANAVEIADYALAQAKIQAWLAGKDLCAITAEEINKFYEENKAAGVTKEAIYNLQLEMIRVNQTGLNFSQQIAAMKQLALGAGIASSAVSNIFSNSAKVQRENMLMASAMGMSYEEYSVQRSYEALQAELEKKFAAISNTAPSVSYTPPRVSSSTKSGSSGSKSEKEPHVVEVDKYKNLSDAVEAVEAKISRLNETLERTYDTERKIALNNDLINLYKDKQDAITALNKARDEEIKGIVKRLREEQNFDIEYNPDTDRLLIKNREHINEVSQDNIEEFENLINKVDELNEANKESSQQWHELAYAIADTKEEIHELNLEQYDKQIDDLKQVYDHTDNLKEQIALNQVLIKLYQEQRDELLRINQSRDDEIAKNVQELRSVGIDISYDPNTDTLEIKNREQLNKLTETAQVKYRNLLISSEELADANKKGSERWKELTYAIAETGDEIDELNHKRFEEAIADAEHMIALMANRKDVRGKDLVLYEQMMNDVLKRREDLIADGYQKNKAQIQELERQWIDLYDTRLEREKELLEMQLDDKDGVLAAVTNKIDEQIEGLDEQTKAIDEQIESMQKVNEEHRKALDYQKAQAALDKARNQRTRLVLRKGKGWVYEADQDAVKDAEETVADLKYEAAIDVLEKQKEALEKQKEALEDYKNLWTEIPDEYEKYQNELLAEQELGADWEQKILEGRLDVYTDFKDDYFDLQDAIGQKTDEIENHMNEAYLNMVRTFQLMADLNKLHENMTDYKQTEPEQQPQHKQWYVQQNGKAPSKAQVGDIVYTKGGTYKITAKDENGKFTSEKLNDISTAIPDNMWGKEIQTSNMYLAGAIGQNTTANKGVVDMARQEIDQMGKQILATHGWTEVAQDGVHVTQEQIASTLETIDILDGNKVSVDGNTVTIGENTYALEDLTKAVNEFDITGQVSSAFGSAFESLDFSSLLGAVLGTVQTPTVNQNLPENIEAGLKSLSSKLNPFDAYDFSKLTGDDKAHYEQLKEAYNTAISQENAVASSTILSQLAGLIIDSGMTANDMSDEYAELLAKQDPYSRVDPLTGLSTKFTEDSKSNAYKGGTVAAIKGTTKTIWGLDASNKDQVNSLVDRGVLTKEEANNLVQISGRNIKSTDENTNAQNYSGDGAYYAGDAAYDVGDRIDDFGDNIKNFGDSVSSIGDKYAESTQAMLDSMKESTQAMVDSVKDSVSNISVNVSGSVGGLSSGSGGSGGKNKGENVGLTGGGSSVSGSSIGAAIGGAIGAIGGSVGSSIGAAIGSTIGSLASNKNSSSSNKSSSSGNKSSSNKPQPTVTKKKKAKGGTDIPAGLYNVDEKGAEMIIEPSEQPEEGRWHVFKYDGNTVLPADISKNLWEFGLNPPMFMQDKLKNISNQIIYTGSGGSSHTVEHHYHVGNVELSGAKDVLGFMEGIRNLPNRADQFISRR